MRKRLLVLAAVMGIVLTFMGCKESHPNEKQMQEDFELNVLNNTSVGEEKTEVHNMNIDSFEIERERTEDDFVEAYCIVHMSDDSIDVTAYYCLHYNYYDKGGWNLDNCFEYQTREILPLTGVNEQTVLQDLQGEIAYSRDYLEYEFTFIKDELDLKNGKDVVYYEVKTISDYGVRVEQVALPYLFASGRWERERPGDVIETQVTYDLTGKTWVSDGYDGLSVFFEKMDDETVTLTYDHDSATGKYDITETITLPYTIADGVMYIDEFYYTDYGPYMSGEEKRRVNLEIDIEGIKNKYNTEYELYESGTIY